jgi:protein-L-isoaspartate(D-aspartate) O-methyltransferase
MSARPEFVACSRRDTPYRTLELTVPSEPLPPVASVESFRRFYALLVTARDGVRNDRVLEAFASVERERFVGPGPWQIAVPDGYISTGSEDPRFLYQDILVGLAAEKGINNGEPSLHAKCLSEANPQEGEVVVHVGAGTGYYTAILAQLVGTSGFVHGYELVPEIAARAAANLRSKSNVAVHAESAVTNLPAANVIYVSAGATHPPEEWLDALALGGRLVLPLVPDERHGCMLLITRQSSSVYAAHIFMGASFIPCVGARDPLASQALAAALDSGKREEVRSLHRTSQPDGTAWCVGAGWWLSTAEAGQ